MHRYLNPRQVRHLIDILNRCKTGEIKALYLVGENPLETLPASFDVKGALEKLDLLICQDPFLTETAKLSHVIFPACTFAEKDGTVTNQEGKVAIPSPGVRRIGRKHAGLAHHGRHGQHSWSTDGF